MSLAQTIFFAIDYFFDPFQNPRKQMKEAGSKVSCAKNIIYNASYPEDCLLDTYVVPKKNDDKYPVILEIHGGGFVAGDKKYRSYLSAWYAVHTGAFVVNANYGLAPKYYFPSPIEHLVSLLDWVKDNATELNLDLNRIIVTGDSAGAFYSAYLSALASNKDMQSRLGFTPPLRFLGCVLNCGIYDIVKAIENNMFKLIADSICHDFTGIKLNQLSDYKYIDVISPLAYVNGDFPKSYIVYAKKDVFCAGQGQAFVDKLNEKGVYNDYFASKRFFDNHTYSLTWTTRTAKRTNEKILDFVNTLFYGEKTKPN